MKGVAFLHDFFGLKTSPINFSLIFACQAVVCMYDQAQWLRRALPAIYGGNQQFSLLL